MACAMSDWEGSMRILRPGLDLLRCRGKGGVRSQGRRWGALPPLPPVSEVEGGDISFQSPRRALGRRKPVRAQERMGEARRRAQGLDLSRSENSEAKSLGGYEEVL